MYGYKVNIHQECLENISSNRPYDSWSKYYSNNCPNYITKTDEYPDVVSTHDVKNEETAILVWVEYSTGDSFGKSTKGSVESIGLFTDIKSANELKKHILNRKNNNQDGYDIKTSDGQVFSSKFCLWNGYFDVLEKVNVDVVEVFDENHYKKRR